jgi:hypothetical protein
MFKAAPAISFVCDTFRALLAFDHLKNASEEFPFGLFGQYNSEATFHSIV